MELIHRRIYIHCGWAIQVPPDLEEEYEDQTGILRLFDDRHEVSMSSSVLETKGTAKAREVLSCWPPKEFKGVLYTDKGEGRNVQGRGVFFQAENDRRGSEWVFSGLHVAEEAKKLLQLTVVVWRAADRPWGVDLWRTAAYVGDDLERLRTVYPEAIATSEFRHAGERQRRPHRS